jgi:CBS domain-containing protein
MQTVSSLMTRDVEIVSPNADLIEVAQHMRRLDVGILPISDGKRVHGVLTKSDIVLKGLAKHRDPRMTRALEVMNRDIDYCYEDQSIEEAQEIMLRNDISHLLVLDHDNNLVGLLSLEDLQHWVNKRYVYKPWHESSSLDDEQKQLPSIHVRPHFSQEWNPSFNNSFDSPIWKLFFNQRLRQILSPLSNWSPVLVSSIVSLSVFSVGYFVFGRRLNREGWLGSKKVFNRRETQAA